MDLCNECGCLSSWPSCMAKTLVLDIRHKVSNFFSAQSFFLKVCEAAQMFMIVDYVREMYCEEVLYGEYGSLEHLLFFLSIL